MYRLILFCFYFDVTVITYNIVVGFWGLVVLQSSSL